MKPLLEKLFVDMHITQIAILDTNSSFLKLKVVKPHGFYYETWGFVTATIWIH